MKAMIFAAGVGSRLKPWTDSHPKALAEVGGVPVIGRVLESLRLAGVDEAVVNVHHFPEQIVDYLRARDFGMKIEVSDESSQLLDTGGGLLLALRRFPQFGRSDNMLLHNADILTDAPLLALADSRRSRDAVAALLVKERDTRRYLMFDREMRMTGWHDLQTGQCRPAGAVYNPDTVRLRAFGGVHAVDAARMLGLLEDYNRRLIEADPERPVLDGVAKFSITDFYIDVCARERIDGFEPRRDYRWVDIGKAATLDLAKQMWD